MQVQYSQKVLDFLSRETVSEQYLVDTTFFYTELAQIVDAPSQLVVKLKMQRRRATPLSTRIMLHRKANPAKETKPRREKLSTKKLKLTNDDMPYAERLKLIGYTPSDLTNIY